MNDLPAMLAALPPHMRDELVQTVIQDYQRKVKADQGAKYRTPDGIVRFVREVIGADPAPYQERILRAFVEYKRVAVRGPHGLGKTALASWVILWGLLAFEDDVKIPITAGAWRQLLKYLLPEIRKWARKARWEGERPRILETAVKLPGKEAFAVASDQPELIEGAHANTLIYVLDESKAIADPFWDAIEGAFSSAGDDTEADAYALAISTPGAPSGRFYDIHQRRPGLQDWHPIHVTLEECIQAGRISRQWAEKRKEQWGETSPVYQNRVLGEFDQSGEDNVIPLTWIEAAHERWYACGGVGVGETVYGCDPARFGDDKTATAKKVGRVIEKLDYRVKDDTMETAGRLAAKLDKDTIVAIDASPMGAGIIDRLRELGYTGVRPVNSSERAEWEKDKPITDKSGELTFPNKRSALWWLMREALDPHNPDAIALPPDDLLTGDLSAPKYSYTSKGQIKVEEKAETKARIGRSPDGADAANLANFIAVQSQILAARTAVRIGYGRVKGRKPIKHSRPRG